jgi:hypothetical protein
MSPSNPLLRLQSIEHGNETLRLDDPSDPMLDLACHVTLLTLRFRERMVSCKSPIQRFGSFTTSRSSFMVPDAGGSGDLAPEAALTFDHPRASTQVILSRLS